MSTHLISTNVRMLKKMRADIIKRREEKGVQWWLYEVINSQFSEKFCITYTPTH